MFRSSFTPQNSDEASIENEDRSSASEAKSTKQEKNLEEQKEAQTAKAKAKDEDKVMCGVCDKTFEGNFQLAVHLKTHFVFKTNDENMSETKCDTTSEKGDQDRKADHEKFSDTKSINSSATEPTKADGSDNNHHDCACANINNNCSTKGTVEGTVSQTSEVKYGAASELRNKNDKADSEKILCTNSVTPSSAEPMKTDGSVDDVHDSACANINNDCSTKDSVKVTVSQYGNFEAVKSTSGTKRNNTAIINNNNNNLKEGKFEYI